MKIKLTPHDVGTQGGLGKCPTGVVGLDLRQAIVEQMQEGAVSLVHDGFIRYSNRRFAEIVRLPLEQIIGTHVREYVVESDRDLLDRLICDAFGNSSQGELTFEAGDGAMVPAYVGLSAMALDGQSSICMVVTDLTERKRAEQVLASERFVRAILNQAGDGIVVCDTEGRITFANAAARSMAGLDPADTTVALEQWMWGKPMFPDGRPIPLEGPPLSIVLAGPVALGQELRMVRDDGSYYDILVSATPLQNPDGTVLGAVATFSDITKRKQAEEDLAAQNAQVQSTLKELRATEEELLQQNSSLVEAQEALEAARAEAISEKNRIEALMEALPVGVALVDARGGNVRANRMFDQIWGGPRPPAREVGDYAAYQAWWVDTGEPVRPDEWASARAVQKGETVIGQVIEIQRFDDGTRAVIHNSAAPILDARGRIIGSAVAILDITQRRAVEEQLKQAQAAAEAANQAKSQFLANMSHDLRTPMNAILGMLDLALGEELSPTMRDYLQTAKESGDALLELLNEILDISRIEAGRFELDQVPFSLQQTVDHVIRTLGVRAYEKGLELSYDAPTDLPDRLIGDPLRLRQVLMNLVGNALKFTRKGEVVVAVEGLGIRDWGLEAPGQAEGLGIRDWGLESPIEPRLSDSESLIPNPQSLIPNPSLLLQFSVSDTGIGIAPQDQEKVFAPFTQADASGTRQHAGSGLGLAIARKLVELMDGRLWVESEPGKGSTFRFTARFALETAAGEEPELPTVSREALRDLPVLVVAERSASRRILEQTLARWGMLPESVEDVPAALAKIHEAATAGRAYSLVLAEAAMPGIDGFTLAEWLNSEPRLVGSVILMVSAPQRSHQPRRCQDVGAFCLEKPISSSELFRVVAETLGIEQQARQSAGTGTGGSLPAAPQRPLQVLLAEDTPASQKLALYILARRGHHVEPAANGQQALALIGRQDFDVVLMDVEMPVMDGFQATAAVRKLDDPKKARAPIIAMTAHALKGDNERCLAAGMDAYISKPIKGEELIELVERLAASSAERLGGAGGRQDDSSQAGGAVAERQSAAARPDQLDLAAEIPPPMFDFDAALRACYGQQRMVQEMVGCFFDEAEPLLGRMAVALDKADADELSSAAHRLKNTVVYLGAAAAGEATSRVERIAHAGDLADAADAIEALRGELMRLKEALLAYRAGEKS